MAIKQSRPKQSIIQSKSSKQISNRQQGLTFSTAFAADESVALESLRAAAPEARHMGHRSHNHRATRVGGAPARSVEPPRQLRGAEVQRRHRRTAHVVVPDGRDEEAAARGSDAVLVEETFPGGVVEAGSVVISRSAAAVEQDGADGAPLRQALVNHGRTVAEKKAVPLGQGVVVAEQALDCFDGAVARRGDVDQEAVVRDVPHREFPDSDGGFRGVETLETDWTSDGESEGIRGRVGAAGSLAVLGGSCRDYREDSDHQIREEEEEEE